MGTNGTTAPTSSTEVGGINPGGNLQPLQTDASGNLKIDIAASAATITVQDVADATDGGTAAAMGTQISGIDETTGLSRVARMDGYGHLIAATSNDYRSGSATGTGNFPGFGTIDGSLHNHGIIQLSGTWVGSVQLQTSNDGSTWYAVPMFTIDSATTSSVSTMTANGLYMGATNGAFLIRVRVTAYTSGTIVGVAAFNNGPFENFNLQNAMVANQATLIASQATIVANQTNGTQKSQLNFGSNVAQVSASGALSTSIPGTTSFSDPFNGTVIDVTNRWNSPVTAGSGAVTQSGASGLMLVNGTTANNAGQLSSQPTFDASGAAQYVFAVGIQLESGTIATGNSRFWGWATQGTAYSTTNPIKDGVGFEVTTAGVLRAVIYTADVLSFSQTLSIPTDGLQHVYAFFTLGNYIFWYMDTFVTPVAVSGILTPYSTLLPIRFHSLNGGSTTVGTPTMNAYSVAIIDESRNGTNITDGTYQWRKATVSSTGALSVSGSTTDAANGPVTPGTVASKSELMGGQFNTVLPTLTNGQQAAIQVDASGRQLVIDASLETTIGSKAPGTAATASQLSGMVYNAAGVTLTDTQQASIQSDSVGSLRTVLPDMLFTGQSAQTATVNNIIPAASSATATDAANYKSASIQIVSTGTAGTFIFEGSNDNSNWQTIPVYSQLILTGTPIVAAITATATQLIYTFPIQSRYIRVRIATTITGGSIQAFTRLSQAAWTPGIMQVAQATAANLNTTATIASGTVTTVTTVTGVTNTTSIYTNADQASAAISTTTTGAAKTLAVGSAISLNVAITAASGTLPTYDFSIQSSLDGSNWNTIYQMPRMITTGFYATPMLQVNGIQYRYIETIGGTTPSFTRTITSNRSNLQGNFYRNLIDRTIAPITTNSVTSSLLVEGYSSIGAIISLGAGGTAPVQIVLDGSDDNSNWVQGLASAYVYPSTLANIAYGAGSYRFIRARVVTGVASTTLNYLTLFASPVALVAPGKSTVGAPIVNNYGSTNITTSAYVQLVASTSTQVTMVDIQQDTSGSTMILAIGPAGQERDMAYIQAGGGTQIPMYIPQGTRIAYKALSANATTGYVIMNLLN